MWYVGHLPADDLCQQCQVSGPHYQELNSPSDEDERSPSPPNNGTTTFLPGLSSVAISCIIHSIEHVQIQCMKGLEAFVATMWLNLLHVHPLTIGPRPPHAPQHHPHLPLYILKAVFRLAYHHPYLPVTSLNVHYPLKGPPYHPDRPC